MMRLFALVFVFMLFLTNSSNAQFLSEKLKNGNIPATICYASDKTEQMIIPPPKEFLLKAGDTKKSEINVTYSLFPTEAITAFEYAVGIWETIIESDIPIEVEANWRSQASSTLGSASPADYVTNFKNIPNKDKYYPLALAEKLAGEHINPYSSPDIVCTFNKDSKWYFGIDQATPFELYDFVTVVLHEIAHGLGFYGFFEVRNNLGLYENFYLIDGDGLGLATAFDLQVINGAKQNLVDESIFSVPSSELYDALVKSALYSKSPSAAYDNNGNNPRLFVTNPWDRASSIYHLNDLTYPPASGNSLMTHAISKGESVHNPGPLTIGILEDMGWDLMTINLDKPKDLEQIKPIVFNTTIDSNNELDSTSIFVVYSSASPENMNDSIPLTYDAGTGNFTATLFPDNGNKTYYYYIKASDIKNREFRLPTGVTDVYNSVSIGPDTEIPVISHTPIPYFVTTESEIPISAIIDDNLGVDTAYVEFSINAISNTSFSLIRDSATLYNGVFPLEISALQDGDVINYRIIAIDSSESRNMAISPAKRPFSFKVEKIADPVIQYANNFNSATTDFSLYDFDVYTDDNFFNGALNSPHPYLSPKQNNKEFNFTALLKQPIILQQNSIMSYDEVVLVEPGSDFADYGDEEFWDYVIVEASKDKGKTWLPLIDGYDSKDNVIWKDNYNLAFDENTSLAVGSSEMYINRQFNMVEGGNFEAGDTILIQFRLFSDPYANGWGWCIDNLQIQTTVSSYLPVLSPGNVQIYPNPFNDLITVSIIPKKQIDLIEIDMYNLYGQKIFTVQQQNVMGTLIETVDLSEYPAGIYLFNIKENGMKVVSKKVVKQ